jgi:hypothetical protein
MALCTVVNDDARDASNGQSRYYSINIEHKMTVGDVFTLMRNTKWPSYMALQKSYGVALIALT